MARCAELFATADLSSLDLTRTTPLLIRSLVLSPIAATAWALALANGTAVRLDVSPRSVAADPLKLHNGTLIRPAQVAHLPLSRVLDLLRQESRPYRAYVRYLGREEAPALAEALRLRELGELLEAQGLRERVRAFNVWLGDGSMQSALHYDGLDNLLVQVLLG